MTLQYLTIIPQYFSAQQVQCLDVVGAFLDLGDAHISNQLLLALFANVTMATEHLLAQDAVLQEQRDPSCSTGTLLGGW